MSVCDARDRLLLSVTHKTLGAGTDDYMFLRSDPVFPMQVPCRDGDFLFRILLFSLILFDFFASPIMTMWDKRATLSTVCLSGQRDLRVIRQDGM